MFTGGRQSVYKSETRRLEEGNNVSTGGRQEVYRRETGSLPEGDRKSTSSRQRVSTGGRKRVSKKDCLQKEDKGVHERETEIVYRSWTGDLPKRNWVSTSDR